MFVSVLRGVRRFVCYVQFRAMSTGKTHTERTETCRRSDTLHSVEVCKVQKLSPTVKSFQLRPVDNNDLFIFQAGQWVDLHIPDVPVVGGYSITCDPHAFSTSRQIGLAIQYSDHAPTHWMHTRCQVGSRLKMRIGGDFVYSPSPGRLPDLFLVAGGIGINPLLAMFMHQIHLLGRAHLLYSAKNSQELIFKDSIDAACTKSSKLSVQYFVTREQIENEAVSPFESRRFTKQDFAESLKCLDENNMHCYICGPQTMIEFAEGTLAELRVPMNCVHTEKWW